MDENKYEVLGPLLAEIGRELADVVGGDPEGVFLYVEIAEGWVAPSIFRDEGEAVRYFDPRQSDLTNLLFDLWYAEDANKRWAVMEYDIKGGKFDAQFKFPEEVDVEVLDDERLKSALRARYGEKPVLYPPPPKNAFELKE